MKKGFFKRNWDILIAYIIFILGILLLAFGLSTCNDFGCLGVLLYAVFGSGFFHIFLIVAMIRNFRNKKLSKIRWFWIITPWSLGLIGNIFFLISFKGMITLILSLLSPFAIFFVLGQLFFQNTFSVAGAEQVSQITIQQFQETLKNYPYIEQGIKQVIGVQ